MSLLTQMVLIEKYGLRVDLDRVAEILETTPPNIRRKISAALTATPRAASRRRLRAGQPLLPRFDIRPRTFRVCLRRNRLAQ